MAVARVTNTESKLAEFNLKLNQRKDKLEELHIKLKIRKERLIEREERLRIFEKGLVHILFQNGLHWPRKFTCTMITIYKHYHQTG